MEPFRQSYRTVGCTSVSAFFDGLIVLSRGLKFNSEAWDDALSVPGFSIGYKPDFLHAQHIPRGLGGFFLCRGGHMGIGVQGESGGEMTQHAG